ncbi:MAG: PAS domain-containing protein [Acidimicrobiia bacterium]
MSTADEGDRLARRLAAVHRAAGIGSWEHVFGEGASSVDWSAEVDEIAGWPADRARSYEAFVSLVHPDDRPAFFEARDAALAGAKPYEIDLRLLRPDGEVRHVHVAAEVERHADGRPSRLVGVLQDRTGEIESLRRLRITEASRRQLLERLLDATDRERDRLARHLATGPIEQLRQVEAAMAAHVGPDAPAPWHEASDAVRRSIAGLAATVSTITDEPATRDLATVVDELAADLAAGVDVRCLVEVPGPLRPAVRAVVVRLVQEGLQNVRKHARASQATVSVRRAGDQVEVRVADDGRGFDPQALGRRRGHFGIASLREDVAALRGTLDIRSGDAGTVIEAVLPTA